jgi:hypothetical protein
VTNMMALKRVSEVSSHAVRQFHAGGLPDKDNPISASISRARKMSRRISRSPAL